MGQKGQTREEMFVQMSTSLISCLVKLPENCCLKPSTMCYKGGGGSVSALASTLTVVASNSIS